MTTVRDLLKKKGNQVWSISPYASVLATLKLLAEKEVGALLVVDEDKTVGIISERDLVRVFAKTETCLLDIEIQNYMTPGVITVGPDATIEECLQVMTQERIRHLPVIEKDKLVGLISIGDVVKDVVSAKESTIHTLENYIGGTDYNR